MKPLTIVYIMACWFATSFTILETLIAYPAFETNLFIRVAEIILMASFVIISVVIWVINIKRYSEDIRAIPPE